MFLKLKNQSSFSFHNYMILPNYLHLGKFNIKRHFGGQMDGTVCKMFTLLATRTHLSLVLHMAPEPDSSDLCAQSQNTVLMASGYEPIHHASNFKVFVSAL